MGSSRLSITLVAKESGWAAFQISGLSMWIVSPTTFCICEFEQPQRPYCHLIWLPDSVECAGRTEGLAQPTPHYTASILEDMSVEEHSQLLADKLSSVGVFREVVCLLKVSALGFPLVFRFSLFEKFAWSARETYS